MAALRVETPQSKEALTEFIQFYDQVYEYRDARWPADLDWQLPILTAESPFAEGQAMRPLLAREGSRILARALAVVDERYNRHWQEHLGHICWFEALPGTREATKLLLDEACELLRSQGTRGARAGFGRQEHPFVIDDYKSLPPRVLRHNPAYYHSLLKDAGFESEKGCVDYKIKVCPELVVRWQGALEAARRAGYEIVPLREIPPSLCVSDFTLTFNDAFKAHWGWTPVTEEEMSHLFGVLRPLGTLDASVIAYRDGEPVGMLLLTPGHTSEAIVKSGRTLKDSEKLNRVYHDSNHWRP
jgi:hypothetical protein